MGGHNLFTNLHGGQELAALGQTAFEIEGDHAGVSAALAPHQLVLRVGGQPGVAHRQHGGVRLQPAPHHQRVTLVLVHPDLQRLQGPDHRK